MSSVEMGTGINRVELLRRLLQNVPFMGVTRVTFVWGPLKHLDHGI